MSVRAGALVHTGDTVLVQRLQSAAAAVNVPSQRINELGNYQAVAVSHDIPDLTFSMESYDASCAMEALLTKNVGNPGPYPISTPSAIDVASEWLPGATDPTPFQVVEGVALPYLMVDSIAYRVGIRDMAMQTVQLRGDSVYYCPGAVVVDFFAGTGVGAQVLVLAHNAGLYNGDVITGSRRTLNVTANGQRLVFGVDYTETITGAPAAFNATSVHLIAPVTTGAEISVTYFTNAVTTFDQSVHTAPAVKPASLRGRDVTVLLNGTDVSADRWTKIQQVTAEERFDIQRDEELGNAFATAIEYTQAPNVTGAVTYRAFNPQDLHARLKQLFNVATSTEAIGAQTFFENRLIYIFHHPDTGAVLKAVEIPDAVCTLPGYTGRANTVTDFEIRWESDSGVMNAYDDLSELP